MDISKNSYAFVLYNKNKKNKHIISNECLRRIADAKKIKKIFPETRIIFVGGNPNLMKNNTNINDVVLLKTAPSTIGNIKAIKYFLKNNKYNNSSSNIMILTGRYHFKRVGILLNFFGFNNRHIKLCCLNECENDTWEEVREKILTKLTKIIIKIRCLKFF